MSIEGQGHSFTIYFTGFVCFVLYLDKISGERLQDHWSSGFRLSRAANTLVHGRISSNFELIQALLNIMVTCKYEMNPIKNVRENVMTLFFPL